MSGEQRRHRRLGSGEGEHVRALLVLRLADHSDALLACGPVHDRVGRQGPSTAAGLVELDVRVPPALYETLVPSGLYYEVVAAGATDTDVREAAGPHRAVLHRLYAHLGEGARETETQNRLLWIHYLDALYFASSGAREPALDAVVRALMIQPAAGELRALKAALSEGEGPIDVSPFLVGQDG